MPSAFDTLTATRTLEAAGIERIHAEAIAATIRDAAGADREELATKADLAALEDRLEAKLATALASLERRILGYGLAIAGLLFAALKLL